MKNLEKVDTYMDKIEVLKSELNAANQAYFEKMNDYMSLKSLFYDDVIIYEQIYNLLVDLREADKEGVSAEEFFGCDSKNMLDQLLQNTPKQPLNTKFWMASAIGLVLAFLDLLGEFMVLDVTLAPLTYLIRFLGGTGLVYALLFGATKAVYGEWSKGRVAWYSVLLSYFGFFFIKELGHWTDKMWQIKLSFPWDVVLMTVLFLFLIILALKKIISAHYLFIPTGLYGAGILARIVQGIEFWDGWLKNYLPLFFLLFCVLLHFAYPKIFRKK